MQRAGAALPPDGFGTRAHSFTPSVPLFMDTESLHDPAPARRLIARPLATSTDVEGMVAVALVNMDTDRVRAGDTVYLSPIMPSNGDLVAVIQPNGILANIDEALTIVQVAGQHCIVWWSDPPNTLHVMDPGTTLRKVVAIIPR